MNTLLTVDDVEDLRKSDPMRQWIRATQFDFKVSSMIRKSGFDNSGLVHGKSGDNFVFLARLRNTLPEDEYPKWAELESRIQNASTSMDPAAPAAPETIRLAIPQVSRPELRIAQTRA